MQCRECGTTIADRAIVCFRCGAPTDLPAPAARRAAPAVRGRPIWPSLAGILAVLTVGLWMALSMTDDTTWRVVTGIVTLGAAYGVWRLPGPRGPKPGPREVN